MVKQNKHEVLFKVWLEYNGEPLIGKGGAKILETIREVKSISKAAKKAGMSYRYVWNYLAKLERRLGEPVVNTYKGGSKGGGGATLNELGTKLLNEYNRVECYLTKVMREEASLNDDSLETGTKNRLNGTVQNVDKNSNAAKVKIKLAAPAVITAFVPQKAVKKLGVKAGDSVEAVVKATDVWVAKET